MKLQDVCEVYSGYALKEFHDSGEGYPVIKIGNICIDGTLDLEKCQYTNDWVNEKYFSQYGDIYVALSGATTGKIGILNTNEKYIINQRVGIVRKKDRHIPNQFIKYFLMNKTQTILEDAAGCAQPNISPKQIGQYAFPDVNYDEMKEIASILDKVVGVIAGKQKQLEYFDQLIKSRFVEMFGNPLDEEKATEYFTNCVIFNPKKTEVKELQGVSVSFVPMECVGVDGSFSIKEKGTVSDYYKGYTYFKDGDVLLAKITPCFENGKVAIAENCENGIGFGTTEFHVSRPIPGVSNSQWIKYLLKNKEVHELATINMTGSAGQKRIQTPFFDKLKIYLPPIDRQEQFAEFVVQVDKSKLMIHKSLEETQMLKDSLMQKYFG